MYEIIEYPNRTDIRLTKGDTFVVQVEAIRRSTGQPYIPEEGDSVRFTLKRTYCDSTYLIEKVIPIDTMILRLESNDTKNLPIMPYVYNIEITFANGDVDTFIEGYLTLKCEV